MPTDIVKHTKDNFKFNCLTISHNIIKPKQITDVW